MTRISTSLLSFAMVLSSAEAFADEASDKGLPLWELGIGAASYYQSHYPGSDVRSLFGFPFPYLMYRGDWLRIDRGVQGIVHETRRLKIDFSVGGTSLLESTDSDARAGMPDLDPTVEAGPAVSLLLSDPARPDDNLWLRVTTRTAFSVDTGDWNFDQQGWILDGRLRYQKRLIGDALRLSSEIGVAFADEDYNGYFYDVPQAYATPQRSAFRSGSGYAGSRLGLGLNGVYGKWRWSIYGAYMNLSGTAFADSPLVDSKHDISLGATISWVFWQSERKVVPTNSSPGGEFDTPLLGF